MRLINADAVAEAINDEIEIAAEIGTHEADVCKGGLIMGLAYVNTAPTIDAVPVVRCRDCKFWQETPSDILVRKCNVRSGYSGDTDYCSYGERKSDE